MGICNKGAGSLAPWIMGTLLLNGMDAYSPEHLGRLSLMDKNALLDQLAAKIIGPYIFIAAVFVVLAVAIYFSSLPDIKSEAETNPEHETRDRGSIFRYPYLWLGFTTLFLYVGVEVVAGDAIQLYGISGLHIPIEQARHFTSFTMIGMLLGYLAGIVLIPKYMNQATALKVSAVSGLVFSFFNLP